MQVFHSFENTNWGRVSLIVAAITASWVGLAALIPEKYHKAGMVILGSAQSALTLMMRSGQSPAGQIREKVEEIAATRGEISDLISKEAEEQAEKQEVKK